MSSGVGASAAFGRAREAVRASAGDAPSLAPALEHRSAELDCLRDLLPAHTIAAAYMRAMEIGVSADRVLIANGIINEETYLRALSNYLGATFEPLDDMPRALCPLTDRRLIEAGAVGLLPIRSNSETSWVVAPRGMAVRRI